MDRDKKFIINSYLELARLANSEEDKWFYMNKAEQVIESYQNNNINEKVDFYTSASQLTETQKIMLEEIYDNGYVCSGDERLQQAIKADYTNLRYAEAKKDIEAIGVRLNKPQRVNGETKRVNVVGNQELFNHAVSLLLEG